MHSLFLMHVLRPMEVWAVSELSCWLFPSVPRLVLWVALWLSRLILLSKEGVGVQLNFESSPFSSKMLMCRYQQAFWEEVHRLWQRALKTRLEFFPTGQPVRLPQSRLALHQAITVQSLCLKLPHMHKQMPRTLGSAAFWFSPQCYCNFLGFFPMESKKHLWNPRLLRDEKSNSPLIAGWRSSRGFLKHTLRNCVLWGLGLKSCIYCCRRLVPQLSLQLFGHCGMYDNGSQ